MTSIVSSNSSTGTSAAAALIPAAGSYSGNETSAQDFQRMLRSHAAQLSISPAPAPQTAPHAAVQVAQPQDGISDTQREETRLSNARKEVAPATAKPIKSAPCTTAPVPNQDGAAAAADDAAQQADADAPTPVKPQPTNAPAADPKGAKPAAAKDGKTTSADAARPADAADDGADAEAPTASDATTTPATLDPAAALAAAQLADKTAAAPQVDADSAKLQPRAQSADATQARQAAGAEAAAEAKAQPGTQPGGDTSASGTTASFAGMLSAASHQATASAPGLPPGAVDHGASAQIAALAGLPSAAANSAAGAAAPAASTPSPLVLSQPLQDPGFASEMSARLSVLASQGVQQAQLHLNPAEMGPVQVQIVVDGQQAQVSFHADNAETRAVLERSLPDLAAALRGNGLTLTGGGVFQAASGGSSNSNGSFQQQARDGAASSAAGTGRIQRVAGADDALPAISRTGGVRGGPVRGVVDLYA